MTPEEQAAFEKDRGIIAQLDDSHVGIETDTGCWACIAKNRWPIAIDAALQVPKMEKRIAKLEDLLKEAKQYVTRWQVKDRIDAALSESEAT